MPACEPLYGAQICKETNALLIFITQTFSRGSDGQCTKCGKAKGDHYTGASGTKYCYVSTTSPCPPPHVYGFVCSGRYAVCANFLVHESTLVHL